MIDCAVMVPFVVNRKHHIDLRLPAAGLRKSGRRGSLRWFLDIDRPGSEVFWRDERQRSSCSSPTRVPITTTLSAELTGVALHAREGPAIEEGRTIARLCLFSHTGSKEEGESIWSSGVRIGRLSVVPFDGVSSWLMPNQAKSDRISGGAGIVIPLIFH